MTDLVVTTGVRDALDDDPVSADFFEARDEPVEELVEEAARRAEANDRSTVMTHDL
jgi:histone H3/H4